MNLEEIIYIGRDNAIRLKLLEDGIAYATAYPTVAPTRWVLAFGALLFDSAVNPEAFSWDAVNSILELSLGNLVTDPLESETAELTVYSSEWPDGIVWLHPTDSPDKLYIRISNTLYED